MYAFSNTDKLAYVGESQDSTYFATGGQERAVTLFLNRHDVPLYVLQP